MSKTIASRTYSKKATSASSAKFDQLFNSNPKSKSVSVLASQTRWGQTKYTAVRKPKEDKSPIKGNLTASPSKEFSFGHSSPKKAKIESVSLSATLPVVVPVVVKRVNKFFKSRSTNSVVDDQAKSGKVSPIKEEISGRDGSKSGDFKVKDVSKRDRKEVKRNDENPKVKKNKLSDGQAQSQVQIKAVVAAKKPANEKKVLAKSNNITEKPAFVPGPRTSARSLRSAARHGNSDSPSQDSAHSSSPNERPSPTDQFDQLGQPECLPVKMSSSNGQVDKNLPTSPSNSVASNGTATNWSVLSSEKVEERRKSMEFENAIQKQNSLLMKKKAQLLPDVADVADVRTYGRRRPAPQNTILEEDGRFRMPSDIDSFHSVPSQIELDLVSQGQASYQDSGFSMPSSRSTLPSTLSSQELSPRKLITSQPAISSFDIKATILDVQVSELTKQIELVAAKPLPPKKKFFSSSRTVAVAAAKKANLQLSAKAFFSSEFDETITPSSTQSTNTSSEPSSSQDTKDDEWYNVQRIRKAHQCHELGETEAFDGDIKFYLDGLEDTNTTAMRCLSIIGLASQAMSAEFRMHLRAHDDMPRIISALSDAPDHSNLAFCTSSLLFIYNQDRLTMDIDPRHLKLMLDLLETKDEGTCQVDKKHKDKARTLIEQMKQRGHGKFLDPANLSAGKLALEALLGLTTKRAGDWFKEELRRLKGLDYLMNTVIKIAGVHENLSSDSELNKIDRTLRVLEAATLMNEENQLYVIDYQSGQLINTCIKMLRSNKESIIFHSDSKIYMSSLLSVLRVFTNITSESAKGSNLMGTKFEELFDLFLEILFEVPSFIAPDSRFDLTILLLCLCINFVEFCEPLRDSLLYSSRKMQRLVEILLDRIEQARVTEQQADDLFESAEKNKQEVVNIDTLLNQVVAKSGKHMEHSVIAACVSLLLGCSVQNNASGKQTLVELLPNRSFDPLIDVLRKLHEFAHLADIMTPSGVKRVERIMEVFKGPSSSQAKRNKLIDEHEEPSLMNISSSFFNQTSDSDNEQI